MTGRLTRVLGAAGTALVGLVLSHSLVYLVRYGSAYGEALAHNGHDLAWSLAVWSTSVLGIGLGFAAVVQLIRLHRAAAALGASDPIASPGGPWLQAWLGVAFRLAIVTAVLLTIQENVERLAVGFADEPDPGLLLSAAYPGAVGVIAVVSLVVGLVVSLFRRRRDALLARIRAMPGHRRAVSDRRPVLADPRPIASLLGAVRALRAPPLSLRS